MQVGRCVGIRVSRRANTYQPESWNTLRAMASMMKLESVLTVMPDMYDSGKILFSGCEPAVPSPPWSSISIPVSELHPKYDRTYFVTAGVLSRVIVLPRAFLEVRIFERTLPYSSRNFGNKLLVQPRA